MKIVYIITLSLALILGLVIGKLSSPKTHVDHPSEKLTEQSSNISSTKLLPQFSTTEIKGMVLKEASKPTHEQNPALMSLLYNEWLQDAPVDALSFAKENNRMDWLLEGLRVAGKENSEEALSWISSEISGTDLQINLEASVYRGLVLTAPEEALSKASNLKEGQRRNLILSTVLREWTKHDPDKAFDWFETQSPSPFLSNAYQSVMHNYINQNPQASSELIAAMDGHPLQSGLAQQVGNLLAKEDPQEALQWAEKLTGEPKDKALSGIMKEWAYSGNSLEALEHVKSLPENDELFKEVTEMIAYADHELLEKQMGTFSEKQQEETAKQLASYYSSYDTDLAKNLIQNLPAGPTKEIATREVISQLRSLDPTQAINLAETIEDVDDRKVHLENIVRTFGQINPSAASKLLKETSSLTSEEKETLQRNIDVITSSPNWVPNKKNYVFPRR